MVGTPGHDAAEEYLVRRMVDLGLEPYRGEHKVLRVMKELEREFGGYQPPPVPAPETTGQERVSLGAPDRFMKSTATCFANGWLTAPHVTQKTSLKPVCDG